MPGAIVEGDELCQPAIALDQAMRRHPQAGNPGKIGVRPWIEPVAEECLDMTAAIFARWQADRVHHQQLDVDAFRPRIAVGRRAVRRAGQPALVVDLQLNTPDGLCPKARPAR